MLVLTVNYVANFLLVHTPQHLYHLLRAWGPHANRSEVPWRQRSSCLVWFCSYYFIVFTSLNRSLCSYIIKKILCWTHDGTGTYISMGLQKTVAKEQPHAGRPGWAVSSTQPWCAPRSPSEIATKSLTSCHRQVPRHILKCKISQRLKNDPTFLVSG